MSTTRREFLASAAGGAGAFLVAGINLWAADGLTDEQRIAKAIPSKAPARPKKKRRLLIFGLNVGYGGHGSIPTANKAFTLMGKETGAFETVVSNDPKVFEADSLKRFDAVFFNNTVGNLFTDPTLRSNLLEFVYGGGGLMGVHGTSVAFTQWPGAIEDWPEFGIMLGCRGANHRENTEHVYIKLDDPDNPVNAAFGGKPLEYRDEFFRFQEVYSRRRNRVLMSIDTEKTDLDAGRFFGNVKRDDNDYALAWIRRYGRGRVFYCTIAHNPYVFWDPKMLEFYLAATQFALGDLDAPTTPSALLSPAIEAREKLGWKLALEAGDSSAADCIEAASKCGLLYLGGGSGFASLDDRARKQVRLKLDGAAVTLLSHRVQEMPTDAEACRAVFESARKLGAEVIVARCQAQAMDAIEKLCDEFDIRLAIEPTVGGRGALRLCRGRSSRVGICGDVGVWKSAGVDPVQAIRRAGKKLVVLRFSADDDAATVSKLLKAVKATGATPAMLSIACEADQSKRVAAAVEAFDEACIELAG